eukprot:COSAG06_NODE_504_length_14946_cov_34.563750_12_plen_161_part_00
MAFSAPESHEHVLQLAQPAITSEASEERRGRAAPVRSLVKTGSGQTQSRFENDVTKMYAQNTQLAIGPLAEQRVGGENLWYNGPCLALHAAGEHVKHHLRENGTFFEFSLCLSRACLGKIMHFIYKWLKKCRFLASARVPVSAAPIHIAPRTTHHTPAVR